MTSTPTDCNTAGTAPYAGHLAEPEASSSETTKSIPLPHGVNGILSVCSDSKVPDKPWVGKWAARTDNARFIFEIEEAVVRGELKSGSKDYSILGKVNELGVVDAKIFGQGNEGGPIDVRGTFPQLQLRYPYAQGPLFKALDGQTIRLCS